MKKLAIVMMAALAATAVLAAPKSRKSARNAAADEDAAKSGGKDAKVLVNQMPRTGSSSCLPAPGIQGATMIGNCYTKPRKWIVIETKYTTYAKFVDQLTFDWHILLETKSATENKGNKAGLAPYSYFNTTVTYYNIPQGSHAACVCLPPSYLELYGEPKAIGFTIKNKEGEIIGGDTVSEVKGIKAGTQFWDNQDIMGATQANGDPMIERRQGLVDRSKTIWALVNPNDYETTMQ